MNANDVPGGGRILVIDDDEGMAYTLTRMAEEEGHAAAAALTLAEGLERVRAGGWDVVFLDVRLPDGSGIEAIPAVQAVDAPPEIIIITGYGDKDGAKTALKSGVWDYIEKPARINALRLSLRRALQYRRQRRDAHATRAVDRGGIVGSSTRLQMCLTVMAHAAQSDASVLIMGATGTGKELFARAIHRNSDRADGPFVVVDCTSLPRQLTESILFGHRKGAFTGAERDSPGLVREADGGTLFLDEVGELPQPIQKTFLRVLQERRFRPVGAAEEVGSDFRLVSATNCDLDAAAESGEFRRDLLFRLRSVMIELPPLRERPRDIAEIARHRVEAARRAGDPGPKAVSEAFLAALGAYPWPGNVRELINAVDSALAMEPASPTLYPKHLPEYVRVHAIGGRAGGAPSAGVPPEAPPLGGGGRLPTLKAYRATAIETAEERYIAELMRRTGGDVEAAGRLSGLKRARLYQLLKKYEPGKPA